MWQTLIPFCPKVHRMHHGSPKWIWRMHFSVCQFWFAFNFNGEAYTFTRLCYCKIEGYCESPTIYNEEHIGEVLNHWLWSQAQLRYNMLMIFSFVHVMNKHVTDSVTLLKHLAREGHKVSMSKM